MSEQPAAKAAGPRASNPVGAPRETRPVLGPQADPLSAMTPRFNFLFRAFARRFFQHLALDPGTAKRLRELEGRGSVVYVMRYASRLDYFLFNTLFLRQGLQLSRFANGIRFYYYGPLWRWLRIALFRRRGDGHALEHERDRRFVRALGEAGEPFFLFLRTARPLSWLRGRRGAALEGKSELDLIEEVVQGVWDSGRPVHLVPLALFWRKGPRARRRFLNLTYGAPTRPSDLAKITSFLSTYRDLSVRVGDPIDVADFVRRRRDEGRSAVSRKLRRALLLFLYREEKVVEGPTLEPRHEVQRAVLEQPPVAAAIETLAEQRGASVDWARGRAAKLFREISANMNSTFLAILNAVALTVMRRLFAGIQVSGLEKVAGYAKRHPLVLVPSHRSYFDFIVVSHLFYDNFLVPPHIAARENMGFGPFGFIWRRCGAFFLRRSFDDPLYKEIFRAYVGYLIREGFTQEFFIEGGRSRTGKTLLPRLGMLSWDVEAFLDCKRRDLFFVPIAITYERLVEEGAMIGELEGGDKQEESMLGLVRARKFLQRRFGSVYVNFGEPISLAAALGPNRERLAGDEPEDQAARRRFVERLGNRIVERINWAIVASATSVGACALLGERHRGMLRPELVQRMQWVVDLLRLQDVRLTPALQRDEGDFADSIASLLRMDLIRAVEEPRGEILYFEPGRRRALEIYRNGIAHFLASPSFLARRLASPATEAELRSDLSEWLDLFYHEIFTPRAEVLAAQLDAFVDHFQRLGWVEKSDGLLRVTEKGRASFLFLAEQTRGLLEAYYAAVSAALASELPLGARAFSKAAAEQFGHLELLGEVERPEASNPITFENAAQLLVRRGVLATERRETGRGGSERVYVRGPSAEELPALRERLAAALAAR